MMRQATALLKKGKVYIQSYSKTTGGAWIAQAPVHVASVDEVVQIGQYVREALMHSRQGIPHPKQSEEWKAIQAPMLEATGARSWGAMVKGSKVVGLECDNGTRVTMTPAENYEIHTELSADDIGEKLIAAFNAAS
jgi:hypothetical protein